MHLTEAAVYVYYVQHEDARTLLTKYSHEKTYRLREDLLQQGVEAPLDGMVAAGADVSSPKPGV